MTPEPLILLPGLLCDAELWRAQADALAPDIACRIADLTLDDSIEAMARRVLDAAPPRFALAGLSMGGYVALEIMAQAPERVSRLALFDTSATPDTEEERRRRLSGIDSLKVGRFAGVTSRMLPRLIHPSFVGGPVGDAVRAMAERVGQEAFLRQQTAILGRRDFRPVLATIAVPTLIAVGAEDAMTPPAESQLIHAKISGSRMVTIPDCGHLPAMEHPGRTTTLLREWLRA
ncbi:alpha/beta fold hydrolase [Aureimonas altamirensis]|uniref:alpha/beta fold hydrolase n=1 Tax=Aureimonas altamirensis TaxID=370622 RepID=UPI00203755EE|nr:alpha/beta fold hydrolase [Aureimonas altamirensis]